MSERPRPQPLPPPGTRYPGRAIPTPAAPGRGERGNFLPQRPAPPPRGAEWSAAPSCAPPPHPRPPAHRGGARPPAPRVGTPGRREPQPGPCQGAVAPCKYSRILKHRVGLLLKKKVSPPPRFTRRSLR